jgi:hypothetical protein
MLHFTPTELVWECTTQISCECRTVGCNKFASLSSVPSFSNLICIGKACHFRQ